MGLFIIHISTWVSKLQVKMDLSVETQIYMLSGVFGGLLMTLGLSIVGLSIAVWRISNALNKSLRNEQEKPSGQANRGYAEDNEAQDRPPVRKMVGDQELTDLGYEIYSGPTQNRSQAPPRKPDLDRGISVQSDFFREGDEDFYDGQAQQSRYGQQLR